MNGATHWTDVLSFHLHLCDIQICALNSSHHMPFKIETSAPREPVKPLCLHVDPALLFLLRLDIFIAYQNTNLALSLDRYLPQLPSVHLFTFLLYLSKYPVTQATGRICSRADRKLRFPLIC